MLKNLNLRISVIYTFVDNKKCVFLQKTNSNTITNIMKKQIKALLSIAMAALMLVSFSACKGDMYGEPMGVALYILIENEDGENLLDPAVDGNLVGKFQAEADAAGKTNVLDWSITKIIDFPYINTDNPLLQNQPSFDADGNIVSFSYPDMMPVSFSGFKYMTTKGMSESDCKFYPSEYYLWFGDYDPSENWKRKVYFRFPSLGKKLDVVWENHDLNFKVKVNGKIVTDDTGRFNSMYFDGCRVITITLTDAELSAL